MLRLTLGEIIGWTRAAATGVPDQNLVPAGVSTDTRTIRSGDLYLALRGERFDGHDFVRDALDRGASAAVVEHPWALAERRSLGGPLLAVGSPLQAMGILAREHRRRFRLPVVAVTGSAGKTTAKEMIAAVLGRRQAVLKTPDNENNEIGVPRALLQLGPEHGAVVVELAARHAGDIRYLCSVVCPTIGVLLNVGDAHLEFFETVERVAKAKGELLDSIQDESSMALVNADDCVIAGEAKRTKGRLLGFGLECGSHFSGEGLVLDQEGCGHFSLQNHSFQLQIPGRHNVYNALAAAAVGQVCGVGWADIRQALADFRPLSMRSETLRKNGICVINDCYNANPSSVRAAIDVLISRQSEKGRRVAVLGDMLELGSRSTELHSEVGRYAVTKGIDILATVGPLSAHTVAAARVAGLPCERAMHFDSAKAMARFVHSALTPGDVVLVKGSRGMCLERIVDDLA